MTPLHRAADKGHLDTVKYLVEQGADMEAMNEDNRTPLNDADDIWNYDIVDYLREQGAN